MKKYKTSDFLDAANGGGIRPNCDVTLQLEVGYAKDGHSKGIWEVDEKFLNGNGVAMGGFLASAADIMMAYAVSSKLNEEQSFASIDLHTTFHRPVLIGAVEVNAKVERLGNRVAYVVASLIQNEKKVADAVSSVMLFKN